MPITLFAFDWSGTLSDDRPPVYVANTRMSEAYGLPSISYEQWLRNSAGTVMEYFQGLRPELTADQIWEDYQRTLSEVVADGTESIMYPAVPALIAALRNAGKVVGVVSAHPQRNLESEAQRYGLRDQFDFMIGDCRTKDGALRDIASIYAPNPATDAIYTGDTIQDMRAGKAAGYRTVAIGTGYQSEAQLRSASPDYYIDSHAEFYPFISQ